MQRHDLGIGLLSQKSFSLTFMKHFNLILFILLSYLQGFMRELKVTICSESTAHAYPVQEYPDGFIGPPCSIWILNVEAQK